MAWRKDCKWVTIGIDEVGRGPLAGPVVVAAVAVPTKLKVKSSKLEVPLRDSKKLSAKQRNKWFEWLKEQSANSKGQIAYATASVYPKVIDRINISQAANLAATRACKRLIAKRESQSVGKVFLDGGLFLSKTISAKRFAIRTVVRGDEKYHSIKLASIIAKVRRDRLMKRYHKKFHQYGFDEHKGYGTRNHIVALKKHGPCPLHRLTFIKNLVRV